MYQSISHIKHLNHCLSEAYDVHGHSHGVGEGEDQPDGASKLWPQTPGDQVVRPSWTEGDTQTVREFISGKPGDKQTKFPH